LTGIRFDGDMTMNVDMVRNWESPVLSQTYDDKDTILYALALGYGSNPTSQAELRFVYERGLVAAPTMAATLCHPGFWISDPRTGINVAMVVHGEQRMTFHKPLPPSGTLRGQTRVTDIVDKGKGKGALVVSERRLYDDASGDLLASIEQVTMCRGDGGFSPSPAIQPKPTSAAPLFPAPEREPDSHVDIPTLPQSALLYRLCADPNPLHADPLVAKAAGFDRPILHGLCTYGIAARALIHCCCQDNPALLRRLDARFSAPVFPGETIRTEIWNEARAVRFRCLALERSVVVITNGFAELGAA